MRIAALVKQIPKFETMTLGPDGRLQRDGLPLEMNAYCRRAVAKAVAVAGPDDEVVVFTLGPPSAQDVLLEAIAWGDLYGRAPIRGVHVCDPEFAGSDTLASARAIRAALDVEGPFDLVLCGRNSVDADTGQVGPQIAELLGWPFVPAVRELELDGTKVRARAELDDGSVELETELPLVIACAERLIDPCKVAPAELEDRNLTPVADGRIEIRRAADLGPGPWGAASSPTSVGTTRAVAVHRAALVWPDLPLATQIERVAAVLNERSVPDRVSVPVLRPLAARSGRNAIAVLVEPGRAPTTAELLGAADRLAADGDATVVAVGPAEAIDAEILGPQGADVVVALEGSWCEFDLPEALVAVLHEHETAVLLAPSTAFGREVSARLAVRLDAGLTGDAIDVEMSDGRLVAWKPAFGGTVLAAIHCASVLQMATLRPGMFPDARPRQGVAESVRRALRCSGRVHIKSRRRDDDLEALAEARAVIGVGRGVDPDRYGELEPLRRVLGAELAATRKVTDNGWMPRSRQIGITGRSIRPEIYVSIGAQGKYNHSVGYRDAGTVIAINDDREAPVFATADVGIVGDWAEACALLAARLAERPLTPPA